MSQPRATRTRSRRGSVEKESEHSVEDILPATVVEAVRKSSRGRILKESSKIAGRMKARTDTEVAIEKTDSSDNDSKDGFKKKKNGENKRVEPVSSKSQPLGLDDLIDDFGDEELEDCESAGETMQQDEDVYNDTELVLELPEDSDEEVSNEIAEEMTNYEPSTVNTCKLSVLI